MLAQIIAFEVVPGTIPKSYFPSGWGKYGWFMWCYGNWNGETEWINSRQFQSESKMPNPTGYHVWTPEGVVATVTLRSEPAPDIADTILEGVAVNLLTQAGIAALTALIP